MAQAKPPDIRGGGSYASKITPKSQDILDDKNVILVRIKPRRDEPKASFDDSICQLALNMLSIDVTRDTIGAQYLYDRGDHIVEVWLQKHRLAQAFSSDQTRIIDDDFEIISVKPAQAKDVSLMVLGAPLNIKDSVISDYVNMFGGKILSPAEHCITKSGLWKNKKSGDRRYKADFSNQILPMGTYHLIGGKKVRFVYPGNLRTCARCHQGSEYCPGNGYANKCKDNHGDMVLISTHINKLKKEIQAIKSKPIIEQLPPQGDEPNQVLPLGDTLLHLATQPTSEFPPLSASQSATSSSGTLLSQPIIASEDLPPVIPVQSNPSPVLYTVPKETTDSQVVLNNLPSSNTENLHEKVKDNLEVQEAIIDFKDDHEDTFEHESRRQRKKRLQRQRKSGSSSTSSSSSVSMNQGKGNQSIATLSQVNGSFIDDGFHNDTLYTAKTDIKKSFATEYGRHRTSTPTRSLNSPKSATETANFLLRIANGNQPPRRTQSRDHSNSKRNRSDEIRDEKPLKQTKIDFPSKINGKEADPPDGEKSEDEDDREVNDNNDEMKATTEKNAKDILKHSDEKEITKNSDDKDSSKHGDKGGKFRPGVTDLASTILIPRGTQDQEPNPPEAFLI